MPEVQKMQQISTSLRERETEKKYNKKRSTKKLHSLHPIAKELFRMPDLCVLSGVQFSGFTAPKPILTFLHSREKGVPY